MGKVLNDPTNIQRTDILKRGDKVVVGASIGINNEKYGWKIMPNWVALIEKAAVGELAETEGLIPAGTSSPYKRAKFNDAFFFSDDEEQEEEET